MVNARHIDIGYVILLTVYRMEIGWNFVNIVRYVPTTKSYNDYIYIIPIIFRICRVTAVTQYYTS